MTPTPPLPGPPLTVTCRNCATALTGTDEDSFVTLVQDHVRAHAAAHGAGEHVPTREQILARAHRSPRTP